MDIHPARQADADLLLRFMEDYYRLDHLHFDRTAAEGTLLRLIDDPAAGRVYLIRNDDAVIGYVLLTLGYSLEFHGRIAFVDELYLLPEHRGQGRGSRVLALVEQEAGTLDVQALRLEVVRENTRARALYERLGYDNQDRLVLTKRV